MPVCSFCKQDYEFPRGTTVVQKDGKIKHYCTSKCRKNSEMGRDNKKVEWVKKSDVAKAEKEKQEQTRKDRLEAKEKRENKK